VLHAGHRSKDGQERVHLDLTSSAPDRDQEIERLLALGARRVDIGLARPPGSAVNSHSAMAAPSLLTRSGVYKINNLAAGHTLIS
jgi:hypothetical protein